MSRAPWYSFQTSANSSICLRQGSRPSQPPIDANSSPNPPRKHVVKKHTRQTQCQFVCPRCRKGFSSGTELQDHVLLPPEKICDTSADEQEDGIGSQQTHRILSRTRWAIGPLPSIEERWHDLWRLLFPGDTDIPSYSTFQVSDMSVFMLRVLLSFASEYQAVIEHFELEPEFVDSLPFLFNLRDDMGMNQTRNRRICEGFVEHFLLIVEACNRRGQEMAYQNKRNQTRSGSRVNQRLLG